MGGYPKKDERPFHGEISRRQTQFAQRWGAPQPRSMVVEESQLGFEHVCIGVSLFRGPCKIVVSCWVSSKATRQGYPQKRHTRVLNVLRWKRSKPTIWNLHFVAFLFLREPVPSFLGCDKGSCLFKHDKFHGRGGQAMYCAKLVG